MKEILSLNFKSFRVLLDEIFAQKRRFYFSIAFGPLNLKFEKCLGNKKRKKIIVYTRKKENSDFLIERGQFYQRERENGCSIRDRSRSIIESCSIRERPFYYRGLFYQRQEPFYQRGSSFQGGLVLLEREAVLLQRAVFQGERLLYQREELPYQRGGPPIRERGRGAVLLKYLKQIPYFRSHICSRSDAIRHRSSNIDHRTEIAEFQMKIAVAKEETKEGIIGFIQKKALPSSFYRLFRKKKAKEGSPLLCR